MNGEKLRMRGNRRILLTLKTNISNSCTLDCLRTVIIAFSLKLIHHRAFFLMINVTYIWDDFSLTSEDENFAMPRK